MPQRDGVPLRDNQVSGHPIKDEESSSLHVPASLETRLLRESFVENTPLGPCISLEVNKSCSTSLGWLQGGSQQ